MSCSGDFGNDISASNIDFESKEAAANAAALQANLLNIKIEYTITDKERAGFNMKEFIKKHFIAGAARQNYEVLFILSRYLLQCS